LNHPDKTAQQFVTDAGGGARWYRTGDLVREDEEGIIQYIGRVDDQVQICGHRVELQEIDETLRRISGNDSAIAVAWPLEAGRAESVYAFLCAPADTETRSILEKCGSVLPVYMTPRTIFLLDNMPVNANGKIDRSALARKVGQLVNEKN
jgi:acyl-coenzyme A synthetase/AMP-(fatty) acid ligase